MACATISTLPSPSSTPANAWQRATLGVVSISDSRDYLEGLMHNVERHATKVANNAGGEVTDSFLDFLLEAEFGEKFDGES